MPTARVDHVSFLEAEERDGVVISTVRRVRVVDLTQQDYRVLFEALEDAGVPANGALLEGAANLILRRRSAKLVDEDRGIVDVDLFYEHVLNAGQVISQPTFGVLLGEVNASLSTVKSNKDIFGELISVQHEYPAEDVNFPGETKIQGGEVEYLQPQTTLTFNCQKVTGQPWLLERFLIGAVNATAWCGRDPEEWLCTGVSWRPLDGENNKFEFQLEFQHNPDGWNPVVVYIDENTGRPPLNLIEGVGYKKVQRYPAVDFENAFGVRSQGG